MSLHCCELRGRVNFRELGLRVAFMREFADARCSAQSELHPHLSPASSGYASTAACWKCSPPSKSCFSLRVQTMLRAAKFRGLRQSLKALHHAHFDLAEPRATRARRAMRETFGMGRSGKLPSLFQVWSSVVPSRDPTTARPESPLSALG